MAEGQIDNIYTEIKCTKIQGQKRGMNVKGRGGSFAQCIYVVGVYRLLSY